MVFSTNIFVFVFLTTSILGYYLMDKKYRNYFLLLVSILFYAWGEPKFVLVMLLSVVVNYILGLAVYYTDLLNNQKRKKIVLIVTVIFNFSLLFVFKYLNFIIKNLNYIIGDRIPQTNIVLPIGISFFTFQAVSYVIDVYRKKATVQKSPLDVGLYIAFFPQLIAGPIVRYETIANQIKYRIESFDDFAVGVKRFIIGLSKKVILANNMSLVADAAFAASAGGNSSIAMAWLGAIAYSFQILFDFSGYSDMAIGLGLMFGFHFEENFNYPYISSSITEFWRRWHISLGTWFRDYVYFPLGGSRVKTKRKLVVNLLVVWVFTGIWHGASWNFVAWGILYFILITFEKLTGYPVKFRTLIAKQVYRIFTLLCILGGWVLFRAENLSIAINYVKNMLGKGTVGLINEQFSYNIHENWALLLICVVCSTPLIKYILYKIPNNKFVHIKEIIVAMFYLFLFLISISFMVTSTHNPFIYFNF